MVWHPSEELPMINVILYFLSEKKSNTTGLIDLITSSIIKSVLPTILGPLTNLCNTHIRIVHGQFREFLGVFDVARQIIDERNITPYSFDFSKVFNSISHSKLLTKLRSIGVRARIIRWFFNYSTCAGGYSRYVILMTPCCRIWHSTAKFDIVWYIVRTTFELIG